MTVRRAETGDIPRLNDLLFAVATIHAEGRPDIFKRAAKKYTDEELSAILACDETPVFVATDREGTVMGYVFCILQKTEGSLLLQDRKTLYIDDLCVDQTARGAHVGTLLYECAVAHATACGCDSVTLNVWNFNESAKAFYEKKGMTPLKTVMELPLGERK